MELIALLLFTFITLIASVSGAVKSCMKCSGSSSMTNTSRTFITSAEFCRHVKVACLPQEKSCIFGFVEFPAANTLTISGCYPEESQRNFCDTRLEIFKMAYESVKLKVNYCLCANANYCNGHFDVKMNKTSEQTAAGKAEINQTFPQRSSLLNVQVRTTTATTATAIATATVPNNETQFKAVGYSHAKLTAPSRLLCLSAVFYSMIRHQISQ